MPYHKVEFAQRGLQTHIPNNRPNRNSVVTVVATPELEPLATLFRRFAKSLLIVKVSALLSLLQFCQRWAKCFVQRRTYPCRLRFRITLVHQHLLPTHDLESPPAHAVSQVRFKPGNVVPRDVVASVARAFS